MEKGDKIRYSSFGIAKGKLTVNPLKQCHFNVKSLFLSVTLDL